MMVFQLDQDQPGQDSTLMIMEPTESSKEEKARRPGNFAWTSNCSSAIMAPSLEASVVAFLTFAGGYTFY